MSLILKPKKVFTPDSNRELGTGWIPPIYDSRDYTVNHPEITPMTKKLNIPVKNIKSALPKRVDLRNDCSLVEDQMQLGSCTANAAVGVVEYYQKRAYGEHIDGSRLFVYKNTRNLMGVTGDTGGWLRVAMAALVLSGVPSENYWPYTDVDPDFDEEPSPFVYSIADNFEAVKYFCHDPLGKRVSPEDVLISIKSYLASGVPSMFGFLGFRSSESSDVKGGFCLPHPSERVQWGHAVAAVGYDDELKIQNLQYPGIESKGALLIRNSWGRQWGDNGYGWIPYDYVLHNLAMDFWSILQMEWVNTNQFHFNN